MIVKILAETWLWGALLSAVLARPAFADAAGFASPAAAGVHSSARLLSAGAARAGFYRIGVEIELEPKIVTYWRQPGDAGAPPLFDFSQSENVAETEVLYPAPKHIVEAGIEVAGYDRSVTFPVRVKPRDAQKPVLLRLLLEYSACGVICLPAKAQLALALPMAGASPFAAAVDAAEALVPKKLGEDEARRLVAVTGGKNDDATWNLRYLGSDRAIDIFAEAPEPLFLESKRGAGDNAFELRLVSSCCRSGDKQSEAVPARVTIQTESGALEAPLRLE